MTIRPDFTKVGAGLNHFLIYFTARSYWGGPKLDVDCGLSTRLVIDVSELPHHQFDIAALR